jgi:hypothetical protein
MGAVNNLNQGDVAEIWRAIRQLQVATPLNSASIGAGGLRVYDGGVITIQNGGLSVTGTASILGTLIASGVITLTGTLTQSGPTTFTGDTKLNGPTHINGATDITGNTTVTGDFKVTGPTHLEGATDIKGTLSVEGATTLKGDMTLTTGKIKAGGMTIDPAADGGSVVFSGGGGVQGVSGVTVLKGGGNAGFTSNTSASMFAAANSVGVTSTAVTITGPTTVTGNLNANAAITNAGMPTTTIAANMYASGSNTFYKVTSAAKFKVDPQPMNLPDSLLAVRVKDWLDRGEVERGEAVRRVPGVIAEEVEAAGGAAFVAYDDDGEIQGVAYDRYALARTEILARRLDEAEARIKELEDAA